MRYLLIIFFFTSLPAFAQQSLPVQTFKGSDPSKPLLFYISGDGGLDNAFSSGLVKALHDKGYSVIGLDARSYFWTQKLPRQAAADIGNMLEDYMEKWKCNKLVMIGYSFGADVLPFIQRRLPAQLVNATTQVMLLSPSVKTDFTIHILGMLGFTGSGESVPAEINRLTKPTVIFFGEDEKTYPIKNINQTMVQVFTLPGSHHYDKNVSELAAQLTRRMLP